MRVLIRPATGSRLSLGESDVRANGKESPKSIKGHGLVYGLWQITISQGGWCATTWLAEMLRLHHDD